MNNGSKLIVRMCYSEIEDEDVYILSNGARKKEGRIVLQENIGQGGTNFILAETEGAGCNEKYK